MEEVRRTLPLAVPPEAVFRILTDSSSGLLGPTGAVPPDIRLGARWESGAGQARVRHRIEDLIPGERVAVSSWSGPDDEAPRSTLVYDLQPRGAGTLLTFTWRRPEAPALLTKLGEFVFGRQDRSMEAVMDGVLRTLATVFAGTALLAEEAAQTHSRLGAPPRNIPAFLLARLMATDHAAVPTALFMAFGSAGLIACAGVILLGPGGAATVLAAACAAIPVLAGLVGLSSLADMARRCRDDARLMRHGSVVMARLLRKEEPPTKTTLQGDVQPARIVLRFTRPDGREAAAGHTSNRWPALRPDSDIPALYDPSRPGTILPLPVILDRTDVAPDGSFVWTAARRPPKAERRDGAAFCGTTFSASSAVNSNMKSSGNRSRFLRTCSRSRFGVTP